MKPVPAIVEDAREQAMAAVRAAASSLREAEVQSAKADKRAEAARGAVSMRRLELGKALIEARKQWPKRGPNAKGWGEHLASEGIEQSTAWRMMRDAGWTEADDAATDGPGGEFSCDQQRPHENSGARGDLHVVPDAPDFDPVPQPRAALPRPGFVLRLGRWQIALADAGMVDALITDHPYGARTHESSRRLGNAREDGYSLEGLGPEYAHWTVADVMDFAQAWSPRVRGWMVALCSHDLIPAWEAAYEAVDRYSFQPVPCVINGMSVRLCGDGPSSWAIYAMVGRPRSGGFSRWGTLPGAYTGGSETGSEGGRGKPSWLMRALVRDYSRAGDLVCDPLAGYGATLIAALDEGRRCIGAELDHAAFDEAHRRATQPRAADES